MGDIGRARARGGLHADYAQVVKTALVGEFGGVVRTTRDSPIIEKLPTLPIAVYFSIFLTQFIYLRTVYTCR